MRQAMITARDGAEQIVLAPDEEDRFALLENLVGAVGLDHHEMRLAMHVLDPRARRRARRSAAGDDAGISAAASTFGIRCVSGS